MKQPLLFALVVIMAACSRAPEERYQQAVKNYDAKKYDLAIAQLDSLIKENDAWVEV